MARKRTVMLKRDDSMWAELIGDIEAVVSSRSDDKYAFTSLHRCDQWDFFTTSGFYDRYVDQGMTEAQVTTVIRNALDGKPQEKWLDGVFDELGLENPRIASFKAMVEENRNSAGRYFFEEMNGDLRAWDDLSATAKLQYIALDAARTDVPFAAFAQVVKETIGDVREAALRVVLEGQKELHGIAELFPDDGRTEPTPLVEPVKDMMDHASALEAQENERLKGGETLSQGISNPSGAKGVEGKLSLDDIRRASQEQGKRREDERSKPHEIER